MSEVKRRGRPKGSKNKVQAVDLSVEENKAQAENRWRAEDEALKAQNKVIDKWYEVRSAKLVLCQRKGLGSVVRTYQGRLKDPRVKSFVDKLKEDGQLREVGVY